MFVAGCTRPIVNSVSAPIMLDVKDSGSYFDPSVKAVKMGTSEVTGLILLSKGDATIETAMKNGNITKLRSVHYEYSNILGIVSSKKTIVWGE